MDDGLRMVQSRACGAWALPGDPTCAGVARRLFRLVANGLELEPDADRRRRDDGQRACRQHAARAAAAAAPANPELWLYLRGAGPRRGARLQGLRHPSRLGARQRARPHRRPRARRRDERTRPRGRARAVNGALGPSPFPGPAGRARPCAARPSGSRCRRRRPAATPGGRRAGEIPPPPAEAMTELEKDLGTRGFGGKLVRADDPGADMAVLSIASGLTVWCRSGAAWLRAPGTAVQQWSYCDLVEVARAGRPGIRDDHRDGRAERAGRRHQNRRFSHLRHLQSH